MKHKMSVYYDPRMHFHYRAHNSPPMDSILGQTKPVHILIIPLWSILLLSLSQYSD